MRESLQRIRLVAVVAVLAAGAFIACSSPGNPALTRAVAGPAPQYFPSFGELAKDRGEVFDAGCMLYEDEVRSPACRFGVVGSAKKVAVLGDSHANYWTPALIEVAKRRGWELTVFTRKSCPAAIVDSYPVCNTWRRNSLRRIERELPVMVFLAGNTAFNAYVMKDGRRLDRGESEPLFRAGMTKTLQRLRRRGIAVTVMRDLPMSLRFVPSDCVAKNKTDADSCQFPALRPEAWSYDYAAAEQVRGVQVIDPIEKVCPGGSCRAALGSILTYRDRAHLSATYSRYLAPWLQVKLQDPFAGSR